MEVAALPGEVVAFPGQVVIRDSKDPSGPVILIDRAGFRGLLDALRSGSFG